MSRDVTGWRPRRHSADGWLWLAGVVLYVFGDLVTTGVGLGVAGLTEAGPLTGVALRRFGVAGALGLKTLALAVCLLLWRVVPWPHRLGVPVGLVAVGGWVVGWNVATLLSV